MKQLSAYGCLTVGHGLIECSRLASCQNRRREHRRRKRDLPDNDVPLNVRREHPRQKATPVRLISLGHLSLLVKALLMHLCRRNSRTGDRLPKSGTRLYSIINEPSCGSMTRACYFRLGPAQAPRFARSKMSMVLPSSPSTKQAIASTRRLCCLGLGDEIVVPALHRELLALVESFSPRGNLRLSFKGFVLDKAQV